MKNLYFITITFTTFLTQLSYDQQIISDLVTSNQEQTPDANMAKKGTTNSVSTGFNGNYSKSIAGDDEINTDMIEGSIKSNNQENNNK